MKKGKILIVLFLIVGVFFSNIDNVTVKAKEKAANSSFEKCVEFIYDKENEWFTRCIVKGDMKGVPTGFFGEFPPEVIELGGKADELGRSLANWHGAEDSIFTIVIGKNNRQCKVVDGCLLSADEKTLYYYMPKGVYTNKVVIPDSVKTISPWAFANAYVGEVVLGKNVENIGEYAFSDTCRTSKFKLTVNKNLKKIGKKAFENSLIKKVKFINSVNLDPTAFDYCNVIQYEKNNVRNFSTVLDNAYLKKDKMHISFCKISKVNGYQIRVTRGKNTYNYYTKNNDVKIKAPKKIKKKYKTKFSYGWFDEKDNKIQGKPAYVTVRPYKVSKNKKKIYGKWSKKMVMTK